MATPLKVVSRKVIPSLYYCQVRLPHKFHTKKPRQKPMERRVFEAVTEPILPQPTPYLKNSCQDPNRHRVEEENPYEQYLIRQLKKKVEESMVIILCHKMPCSNVRFREVRIDFEQIGFSVTVLNTKHFQMLIKDTEKANLSYLLGADTAMIASPDIKFKEAWTLLRKTPELVPLGGFCHDRLFTKDQFQEFSKLPSVELLLGELVSCLNLAAGGKTSSLLNSHQQTLSANLQQYHKQKTEES